MMAKSVKELLNRKTFSPQQLADKHGVSLATIKRQLGIGRKVEKEHTKSAKVADEIARDHVGERADYYSRLHKANLEENIDWDSIFSFLAEAADEAIKFTESQHEKAPTVTTFQHTTKIDGHYVHVFVDRHKSKDRDNEYSHKVMYMTDWLLDRKAHTKPITPETKAKILVHVGKAVHTYIENHVRTTPGTHSVEAIPYDKDDADKADKAKMYNAFFPRVAKATGGKYEKQFFGDNVKYKVAG